jgi:hypothetical protein
VRFNTFDGLLGLSITCDIVARDHAALLILGDDTEALAQRLAASGALAHEKAATLRVLFGLPILTAPFPLFVGGLMTERNTALNQLSLFAWIEDNFIDEPRAEVFGLTPFGEQPVLFVRDFDLDRPIEAWFQSQQPALQRPARWTQVAGVAIGSFRYAGEARTLPPDEGALIALEHALPHDAQPFVEGLRLDVARGISLKAALRARRKTTDAALMSACDGWRVLSRAATFVQISTRTHEGDTTVAGVLRLAPPRKW